LAANKTSYELVKVIIGRHMYNIEGLLILSISILLLLPIFDINPYFVHIIILSTMFAVMAAGWNMLAIAGPVSLGHATFFGLGAYFTYFSLTSGNISSYVALLVSVGVALTITIPIGYITFRFGITGIYFALVTIAFAEILRQLFISLREITGGSLGVSLFIKEQSYLHFIFDSKMPYYYLVISIFLAIFLINKLALNRFLKILTVIGNDELTAASMGINILKYKLLAFALSSIVNSIIGWFYIHYLRYITPDVAFGLLTSVEIIIIGILGMLNFAGIFFASLFIIPLGEVLRAALGGVYAGLNIFIYGLILLLLVIIRSIRIGKR
jgi:branched-chain amino acid transport system permease protein